MHVVIVGGVDQEKGIDSRGHARRQGTSGKRVVREMRSRMASAYRLPGYHVITTARAREGPVEGGVQRSDDQVMN